MQSKAQPDKRKSKHTHMKKLAFYCQLCQKQCDDANGYRNHLTTDEHRRNSFYHSQDADANTNRYSESFAREFLQVLGTFPRSEYVDCHRVYNVLISRRGHTHLSATRWTSVNGVAHGLAAAGRLELRLEDERVLTRLPPTAWAVQEGWREERMGGVEEEEEVVEEGGRTLEWKPEVTEVGQIGENGAPSITISTPASAAAAAPAAAAPAPVRTRFGRKS